MRNLAWESNLLLKIGIKSAELLLISAPKIIKDIKVYKLVLDEKNQFIVRVSENIPLIKKIYYKQKYINRNIKIVPNQLKYFIVENLAFVIEEFIEGSLVTPENKQLLDIEKVGSSLSRLHQCTTNLYSSKFIKYKTLNLINVLLKNTKVDFTSEHIHSVENAYKYLQGLDHSFFAQLAHEDISHNLLNQKNDYKFIDFEHNRNISSWFDLADLIDEYGLDNKEREHLIKSYILKTAYNSYSIVDKIVQIFLLIKIIREVHIFKNNEEIKNLYLSKFNSYIRS